MSAAVPLRARPAATLVGLSAILMWSFLALLTSRSGAMPPFQLSAVTFTLGTLVGIVWLAARREPARGVRATFRQPLRVWIVGVGGLFGYHALYFAALRHAPAAEASLIAYLWPLLIVLGSAMLPGERLRTFHVAGALLGLAGAGVILAGHRMEGLSSAHAVGYALAFSCALVWSGYSLLSRRFGEVPSGIVAGFCAATAGLSFLAHLVFETTIWPGGVSQWMAVLALGFLPVGAAFYVWDVGMKQGDVQLLGAASYAAPLLSILVLIVAGEARLTGAIVLAAVLITAGAALAALPLFRRLRFNTRPTAPRLDKR